jgi:alkylated DNA repair protein alkB family protein 8
MARLEYSIDLDAINLNTYEAISTEFSETRAYVWQCIKDFTKLITQNSNVLEIGCGNGKNIEYILKNVSCNIIGIDTCEKFVDMCRSKELDAQKSSILNLEFEDSKFDFVLCIAVFHHLLSDENQLSGMNEIIRVMKPGSTGIITCWATEQPTEQIITKEKKFTFHEGINIVPWKGRQDLNKTRYYYVYSKKMFLDFFGKFDRIEILKVYNEVGNWIIFFKKKL